MGLLVIKTIVKGGEADQLIGRFPVIIASTSHVAECEPNPALQDTEQIPPLEGEGSTHSRVARSCAMHPMPGTTRRA